MWRLSLSVGHHWHAREYLNNLILIGRMAFGRWGSTSKKFYKKRNFKIDGKLYILYYIMYWWYFEVFRRLVIRSRHLEVVLRSEMRSFYGIQLVMNHGFDPLSCMTLELDHKCYFFKWSWYILIKTSNMLCKSINAGGAIPFWLPLAPSPTKRNIPRCQTIKNLIF